MSDMVFFAALPFTEIMAGTVTAAVIYFVMLLGVDNIANTWLWRVPFLLLTSSLSLLPFQLVLS